jgi:peptidylprolyl isomerase
MRHRILILPVLLAALALPACGSSSNSSSEATATATTAATDTPAPTATATPTATPTATATEDSSSSSTSSHSSYGVKIGGSLKSKPTITVKPGETPPTKLISEDLHEGTGAEAKSGDQVTVDYVGANFADGKQFDASWDRHQTFPFQLGGGQVIPGWDQGVVGMKVGGRRLLIIPPSLGYGAQANGPIVANETLIFVVDLRAVSGG